MNKRSQTNLVLLILVGILSAGVYLIKNEAQPTYTSLTHLKPNEITQLKISNAIQSNMVFEKKQNKWQMTAPKQASPTNSDRVQTLLKIAETPSFSHFPVPTGELTQFGLNPPKITLYLNNLELAFGILDPMSQRRYVRIQEQIHLIEDGFYHHLAAPLTDYLLSEGQN